jgi:hypothetical protein
MKRSRVAVALAVGASLSCGGEAVERPPSTPPPAARASDAPFPETAFRAGSDGAQASRFETRRIGDEQGRATERRYRGAPVDLDLKNVEVAEVFRLLADVGKVNVVVAGDVTGTVTLRLAKVPWDQALEIVARSKGLEIEVEGNVILVRRRTP